MGLFNFFKKKEQPVEISKREILIAMAMFNNGETFELNKVADYLKNNWNLTISDINGENGIYTFLIQGETIALATMPVQIPWGDIESTAQYAYNWMGATKDLENHNSHVIVTVMSSKTSDLDRFKILTKVLTAILATSNCLGVYKGTQSLLIPREQYLESAESLKTNQVPIDLWVYIGLRQGDNGNSAYTFGLSAFSKLELEFINANLDLEEMHTFLCNISSYIIEGNVTLKSGETLGYTAEQKIKITMSKGQFLDGQTLRLEM